MVKVSGTCDERFKELEKLFQASLDSGEDLGASIVVNIGGKNVVDLWGGYADKEKTKPWEENTITNVWSSSKTVLSLAALVLVDRGLLDPYEKVSKYWPEFAVNGKEDIEVRHFLSHTSGLSGFEEKVTYETICDEEKATALLEKQAPWWIPGTASGYHSMTMGHLVGEVVRRVSGKPLKQFIAEELAGPLSADYQLGVAEKDLHRVSDVVVPPPADPSAMPPAFADPTSIGSKTLMNPLMDASIANTPLWRKSSVGAANGHTNVRGIVGLLSHISLNGTAPNSLLKSSTVDMIFHEQSHGMDLVMGALLRFGIGYGLSTKGTALDWMPEGKLCMWGGWGGSMVICDVDRGVTIAYMMNRMLNVGLGEGRAVNYIKTAYKGLGVEL